MGWTIELWVKPAELRTATLLNWGSTGLLEGMNVHQYYDALVVDWNDTANAPHAVVAFGIFAVDTWVRVGITYDRVSGMGRIYKNGVLVQEQAMGIFATQTNLPLFFGRYRDSSEFYNGTLDEISLYTRPLGMSPKSNRSLTPGRPASHRSQTMCLRRLFSRARFPERLSRQHADHTRHVPRPTPTGRSLRWNSSMASPRSAKPPPRNPASRSLSISR